MYNKKIYNVSENTITNNRSDFRNFLGAMIDDRISNFFSLTDYSDYMADSLFYYKSKTVFSCVL